MKKAYLDCVKKTITFNVKEQSYTVDLTEGDLDNSTNTIRYGKKVYDTNFNWDEEEGEFPNFAITPVKEVKGGNGEDPYFEADWDESISYDVEVINGDVQDYFGKVFPLGHLSWSTTLVFMTREIDAIPNFKYFESKLGGFIGVAEQLPKFADEFEREHEYTDWEEEDYDETIVEFLTEKLENY